MNLLLDFFISILLAVLVYGLCRWLNLHPGIAGFFSGFIYLFTWRALTKPKWWDAETDYEDEDE